jgi:hypothetical protein
MQQESCQAQVSAVEGGHFDGLLAHPITSVRGVVV